MSTSQFNDPQLVLQYLLEHSTRIDDCLVWQGRTIKGGYGQKWWPKNNIMVHRAMWEVTRGKIPDGYDVCHICDNPPCVNINHLFLANAKANLADARHKGRTATGSRNKKTKLTEDQVRIMKKALQESEHPWATCRVLATVFNVSVSTVYAIWTGRTWSHLDGN